MSKIVALNDIESLANTTSARTALNQNFQRIEDAFQNTLSRDGSTPNQMEADIDLNNNDLLNVGTVDASVVLVNGQPIQQEVTYGDVYYQIESGTGAQTVYSLDQHPGSLGNLEVSVGGVVLRPGLDYSFVGQTLTFAVAPALGTNNILIRYAVALLQGTMAAGGVSLFIPSVGNTNVQTYLESVDTFMGTFSGINGATQLNYTQTGVGAVTRTVYDGLISVVRPEEFGAVGNGVADDEDALNKALERAQGGILKLTAGKTYGIGSALIIRTNTTLDARGATIKRIANSDNMIRNYMDGVTGGWGASTDIKILGGTWDANGSTYTTACTLLAIGHASRVDIIDITTMNVPTFHHIEINGSKDVRVINGTFQGGNEQLLQGNEAIQIDHSYSGSGTWFTPYDNQTCQNVLVTSNNFLNTGTGVGTHSGSSLGTLGLKHDTITITNNRFYNCYYAGVRAENWSGLTVNGNRFSGGAYGVLAQAFGTEIMSGPVITDNQFYGMGNNGYAFSDCRAVRVLGITGYAAYYQRVVIKGNLVADLTANGASIATHGITVDYCQNVNISGNLVNNTRGAGIYAFNVQWTNITGNTIRGCNTSAGATWAGIVLGNSTSVRCNVTDNLANSIRVANLDRGIVMHNQVTDVGGLTTASNTSVTVSRNLVDTTFA